MKDNPKEFALMQTIKSQKETFDALLKKYNRLNATFEEVLVKEFSISELRDFYRERAGTINKS